MPILRNFSIFIPPALVVVVALIAKVVRLRAKDVSGGLALVVVQ